MLALALVACFLSGGEAFLPPGPPGRYVLAAKPTPPAPAATLRMGWSDPDWRWGSPVGAAHDLAMALRGRLNANRAVREDWLIALVGAEGNGGVDIEEAKLGERVATKTTPRLRRLK